MEENFDLIILWNILTKGCPRLLTKFWFWIWVIVAFGQPALSPIIFIGAFIWAMQLTIDSD